MDKQHLGRKRTRASVARECTRLLATTRTLGVLVQRKVLDIAEAEELPSEELLKCLTWVGGTLRWMSEEKRKPALKQAEAGENLEQLLGTLAKLDPERAGVMSRQLANAINTSGSEH